MPFCTPCGRQNPDDARFCAQCGTRRSRPAGRSRPWAETTATIQIGVGGDKAETGDRALNPVDAAAVDALPSVTRCSSSRRDRAPAAGSCSTSTW